MYNEYSASFPITNGVRQGCPMSPFLFNFVVDDVLSRAFASGEAGIDFLPGTRIRDLDYADDIVIFGDNPRILQATLDKLTFEFQKYSLQFAPAKCKVLIQDWHTAVPELSIGGQPLDIVDSFTYLGSVITATGEISSEISARICKARTSFVNLRHLWRRRDLSLRLKGLLYSSVVRSVLLYGCERWSWCLRDMQRLAAFHHWCMRSIACVW